MKIPIEISRFLANKATSEFSKISLSHKYHNCCVYADTLMKLYNLVHDGFETGSNWWGD